MTACAQEPIPSGWSVWRGSVPAELTQFAIDVRDHINSYPYGQIADTIDYNGQKVAAFKSHHTWTWRGGQLLTGICIPGVSLLKQPTTTGTGAAPSTGTALADNDLSTPDPTAAVFGIYDNPPASTDWGLVAISAGALVLTVGAFMLAIRMAGTPPVIR